MRQHTLLSAFVAVLASASTAEAEQVAALIGGDTIAVIDTSAKKVTKSMKVTGTSGPLLGIDVRPADGMLYGLVEGGTVVTIGMDGKATMKSKLETTLAKGVAATVDFNPVADRLRVMGSDGANLRVNVDDGKVVKDGDHKFAEGLVQMGEKPRILAGAYTNSFKGAKETTLYAIDGVIAALVKQAPPNEGVISSIGKLGIKADRVAFDIVADGKGGNAAWLWTGGALYSVDLASGKAADPIAISGVTGTVMDIAILPAM